jgi:hypothetical protein
VKQTYDLKEVIDRELQKINISDELRYKIQAQCENNNNLVNLHKFKKRNKAVVYLVAAVLLMYGSIVAVEPQLGFRAFLSQEAVGKVSAFLHLVSHSMTSSKVIMTVEEAMADGQEVLCVFSFTKKNGEPWPDKIEAENVQLSWMRNFSFRHALSEDKRKLSYYVMEGVSEIDSLDLPLQISAENLIIKSKMVETIDKNLSDLYPLLLPIKNANDGFDAINQYCHGIYQLIAEKKLETIQESILLDKRPGTVLQGIDIVEGTLRLVTRSELHTKHKGNTREKSAIGYVSQITDTRTGMIYASQMRNTVYTPEEGAEFAFVISEFSIQNKEQLRYLKMTQVSYDIVNTVQAGKWEVKFLLNQQQGSRMIDTNIQLSSTREEIDINQVAISSLGIRLKGRVFNKETGKTGGVPEKEIAVWGTTLKGENIDYKPRFYVTEKEGDGFILNYRPTQEEGMLEFLDKDQLTEIKVADTIIWSSEKNNIE